MTVTTAFPPLEVLQQEVLMAYHLHVTRIQKWIKYLMDTGMELCSMKVTEVECDDAGSRRSRKITGGLQAAGTRMIVTAMRLSREELTSAMYLAKFQAETSMKSGKPLARGAEQTVDQAVQESREAMVSAMQTSRCAAQAEEEAVSAATANTPVRAAEEVLPEALAREAEAVFATETQPQMKQARRRERRELAAELAKTNL